jgi:hypothetical protein
METWPHLDVSHPKILSGPVAKIKMLKLLKDLLQIFNSFMTSAILIMP